MNVSYLGPRGTFTHEAATAFFADASQFEPRSTVVDVLRAVDRRESMYGVVPIENSVQGEVTTTMDALVFDFHKILIIGEIVIPVSFYALRKKGSSHSPASIHSHPHALAQCTRYVQRTGVPAIESTSTADACELVAAGGEPGAVAIASRRAGEMYGLEVIEADIEDYPGAETRFLAIGIAPVARTGTDKSSFTLIPKNQNRGVLAEVFDTLADRSLEVYSVHSRPVRRRLGTYSFFLTVSGHIDDPDVFAALSSLLDGGHRLKFLGSYKAFPDTAPPPRIVDISGNLLTTASELAAYRTK